ncbi:hypothetical protein BGX38DRAFT_1333755 [Terfezia claveryi]|nr:hypothetical protein BGX38DRAFT_1333755 [Terfezia claveryi]
MGKAVSEKRPEWLGCHNEKKELVKRIAPEWASKSVSEGVQHVAEIAVKKGWCVDQKIFDDVVDDLRESVRKGGRELKKAQGRGLEQIAEIEESKKKSMEWREEIKRKEELENKIVEQGATQGKDITGLKSLADKVGYSIKKASSSC